MWRTTEKLKREEEKEMMFFDRFEDKTLRKIDYILGEI